VTQLPRAEGAILLYVGFVLTGVVNTLLGPVLPWLTTRWSLSDAAAGSLFTVQFAGGLLGGAVSGLIASRAGAGLTMGAGYLMMAAGLAAVAAGGLDAGRFGMFVAGLGLGFVIPITNLMAARLAPTRPAAALGAVNLCWGLGAAIWPLIVLTFSRRASVPAALATMCGLLVLMAAWIMPARFPTEAGRGGVAASRSATAFVRLAVFGICIALYSGTEAAFGGWITEYAIRLAGPASTERWEIAASAFWGGVAGGRAIVSIWLTRRVEDAALLAGLAVVCLSLAVLLAVPRIEIILIAAVLCGLGLSPVFPATVAALSREFPGSLAGPMVAMGSVGAGALPLAVGAISDRTGSLSSGLAMLLASAVVLSVLQAARLWGSRLPG
jgi:MFS transporter, FHS family, glucose/mannose:H+ symporter